MTAPNIASGNPFLGGYIGCEIGKNKFLKEKFVFGQYFKTIYSRVSLEKRC